MQRNILRLRQLKRAQVFNGFGIVESRQSWAISSFNSGAAEDDTFMLGPLGKLDPLGPLDPLCTGGGLSCLVTSPLTISPDRTCALQYSAVVFFSCVLWVCTCIQQHYHFLFLCCPRQRSSLWSVQHHGNCLPAPLIAWWKQVQLKTRFD